MSSSIEAAERLNGSPTKQFFIEMLTRDITLVDSILDLIDNSIHSLLRETKQDVYEMLLGAAAMKLKRPAKVLIHIDGKSLSIEDDCGGIPYADAHDTVFRFGASPRTTKQFGLGVFGVGMKRAFFKVGKTVDLTSNDRTIEFRVKMNVNEWMERPDDWTWEVASKSSVKGGSKQHGGTSIKIVDLNSGVSEKFSRNDFQAGLIEKIATTYALLIKCGLRIEVNGTRVKSELPEIVESERIIPVKKRLRFNKVDALVIVGLTERAPAAPPGGWYVFCNGRMVVESDRSSLTGWGVSGTPNFHSKYNRFVGYVYFRSTDLQALPWTTTKQGVLQDSLVYMNTLAQMQVLERPILDFMNDFYPSVSEEGLPAREILKDARTVNVTEISKTKTNFSAPLPRGKTSEFVTIQFEAAKKDVERVRAHLKKPGLAAYRVGELAFKHYLDTECEPEE